MLTSITKIVDKSFVVGFVVPVLLAAVGILAIVQTKNFANLTIIALLLWAAAILLLILNHHLYRVLEGYSGPFSWINKWKEQAWAQYESEKEKR
jgi:hypothetical protein